MAEGVLHEFEGWVVFMVSALAVLLVAIALTRMGRSNLPPAHTATKPTGAAVAAGLSLQSLPRSFVAAAVLVAAGVAVELSVPERPEIPPARSQFVDFPATLGGWVGTRDTLEQVYLDGLRLDDYLLMNYRDAAGLPINLYVAYYQSQRNGLSVHSPRLCLPGGGWKILAFERYDIPGTDSRPSWPVNRIIIEQAGQRQLVYYWFRERGRRLTNEYVVRWYLFWDALKLNRTDGALVRLTVPIPKGAKGSDLDGELTRFALLADAPLGRYVPD